MIDFLCLRIPGSDDSTQPRQMLGSPQLEAAPPAAPTENTLPGQAFPSTSGCTAGNKALFS